MDGDRKYRQNGYQQDSERGINGSFRGDKAKPQGPRPPLDITGPKLPRLVQNVVAYRCFSCATALASDTDFKGNCPKCNAALHCCKQCVHFDSSTRFQCHKPVPVRIPIKDQANTCEFFMAMVTVARDAPAPASAHRVVENTPAPRNASAARAAFDSLFKK